MKSQIKLKGRISAARPAAILATLAAMLVISSQGLLAVEGPVAALQEALKEQQLFFGEPSGVLDDRTQVALRRFQIRHSLPNTGEIDNATLDVLQKLAQSDVPPPAKAKATPTPARPKWPIVSSPPKVSVVKNPAALPFPSGRESVPPAVASSMPSIPLTPVIKWPPPAPELPPVRSQPPPNERVAQSGSPSPLPAAATGRAMQTPEVPKNLRAGKRGDTPVQRLASAPLPRRKDSATRVDFQPILKPPPPVGERRTLPVANRIAKIAPDRAALAPESARIIRTTTTTHERDGSTTITERKTTITSGAPAPIVRRAEPVQPQPRERLRQRIFTDD